MVTMMSKTERAVRMKAVMPGSLSSAAKMNKRRGELSGEQEGRRGVFVAFNGFAALPPLLSTLTLISILLAITFVPCRRFKPLPLHIGTRTTLFVYQMSKICEGNKRVSYPSADRSSTLRGCPGAASLKALPTWRRRRRRMPCRCPRPPRSWARCLQRSSSPSSRTSS